MFTRDLGKSVGVTERTFLCHSLFGLCQGSQWARVRTTPGTILSVPQVRRTPDPSPSSDGEGHGEDEGEGGEERWGGGEGKRQLERHPSHVVLSAELMVPVLEESSRTTRTRKDPTVPHIRKVFVSPRVEAGLRV